VDESPYVPLNDFVLLQRIEKDSDRTPGGILIPDAFQKKNNKAVVIAVGEGRIIGDKLVPITLEAGDIVLFTRYGGQDTELDDEEYILVRSAEVMLKARKKKLVQ